MLSPIVIPLGADFDTIVLDPEGMAHYTTSRALAVAELYCLESDYSITNIYGDGIIRIAEGDGRHDLFRFVRPDGSIGSPRTWASVDAVISFKSERQRVAA